MQVQVKHRLLRILAAVENGPVVSMPEPLHYLRRDHKQVADDGLVVFGDVVQPRDHLLGDDQNVRRRLRVKIVDDDGEVILIGNLRGDLPGDDFFEDRHENLDESVSR